MNMRRAFVLATLLAMVSIIALSFLAGCDSTPETPDFENPFDPNASNGGDPFELTATMGDSSVTLMWNQLQDFDISSYVVLHSMSIFDQFFSIGSVEATTQDIIQFEYDNPEPTATHYFKIQAFNSAGEFSGASHITPTSVDVLAMVQVNDGSRDVPSRNISLSISVTDGDSLRISQDGHPESEVVLPADISGTATELAWDLGSATSNDTTMTISVVVQFGVNLGDTNKVVISPQFSPRHLLHRGGTKAASLNPLLDIVSDGVVFMRFANEIEDLPNLRWEPGADTFSDFFLVDSANSQFIYAEYMGDFGFSVTKSLPVTPDLLTAPEFSLDLPADHITDEIVVTTFSNAVALQMRFAETLDFASVPWVDYSDTSSVTLTSTPGQKSIYAQYRNDFADSPILTDYVIYLSQPLNVAINAPTEGNLVMGGTVLGVLGTAAIPSGSAVIDSVKFDGGSVFEHVTGTENWTYDWTIPRYDADTDLIVRARAWAGEDSVTTSLSLTVTQILLDISSHADGDTLTSDTDVTLSGSSSPPTEGTEISSVTVTIDGDTQLADGTTSWSYDWHPDLVVDEEEIAITVTANAGNYSYSQSVSLLVVAPE